jgi:hypothetical protein
MSLQRSLRAFEAARRREEREAQKRRRELERLEKEAAKLSASEQARLEVDSYKNRVELLLSVHKERGEDWDWTSIAASLPPLPPRIHTHNEMKAKRNLLAQYPVDRDLVSTSLERAHADDRRAYERAMEAYLPESREHEKSRALARRILAGDIQSYVDAFIECSPVGEITNLGSSVGIRAHSSKLVECRVTVHGIGIIPEEIKTLTSTGKVSVRSMPKARFQELYQDYVASCMLRIAREVFALLPVDEIVITAIAALEDSATGQLRKSPVLSAVVDRSKLTGLDFERLDPSDTIESFPHRGDFKASRKSGAFQPIEPISPGDLEVTESKPDVLKLLSDVRRLRAAVREDLSELNQGPAPSPA